MSQHAVYSIGRSQQSDLPLEHSSISRRHAELVIASDGRHFLSDCHSSGGTFVQREGSWAAVKQGYIEVNERLRFGEFQISLQELLLRLPAAPAPAARAVAADRSARDDLPEGPVHRNLQTGEVVAREPK